MLRRTACFLEAGIIHSWGPRKSFGFATVNGSTDTVFVHQSNIVQPRNSRPIHSIKRGVAIQFDISKDDTGRTIAKNITSSNGGPLTTRDEIPAQSLNLKSLQSSLGDKEDDSRHGLAIKGIVESITQITLAQRKITNSNRNIIRLINAISKDAKLEEVLTGEKYMEAKSKVMVNVIAESEARRALRGKGKGDDDDDEDEDEEGEEEEVEVKKESANKGKKAAATTEESKADEKGDKKEFHSADDLLDLMDDGEKKAPKGKKGKK